MTEVQSQSKQDVLVSRVAVIKKAEAELQVLNENEITLPGTESYLESLKEARVNIEEQLFHAEELEKKITALTESLDGITSQVTSEVILREIDTLTKEFEIVLDGDTRKIIQKELYGQITLIELPPHESSLTEEPSRVIEGTYTVKEDATVKEILIKALGEEDAQTLMDTSDECREEKIDWNTQLTAGQEFKFVNLLNSNNMERDIQEKYYGEVNAELANPLAHTLYRAELVSQVKKLDIDLSQGASDLKEEVSQKLGELAAEEIYQLRCGVSRDASGALYVRHDGRLCAYRVDRFACGDSFAVGSLPSESK